jgi:hypothetical protein
MLSIDPKMLPRLDKLEQDLLAGRERAIAENLLGEIDGLNLTLTFLRSKRRQAQRGAVLRREGQTFPIRCRRVTTG